MSEVLSFIRQADAETTYRSRIERSYFQDAYGSPEAARRALEHMRQGAKAFEAGVEAIKADCRARRAKLAADRASFWERATDRERFLSDVEADYAREYDGAAFVEGGG